MRIVVTGATGFIGQTLIAAARRSGATVHAAVRNANRSTSADVTTVVGEIGASTDWRPVVDGAAAIIHLAARAHMMNDSDSAAHASYFSVNVEGTRRLAHAALEAGVRRFVYVSSIKVNGETTVRQPFRPDDPPAPTDAYGQSKWEAEQVLRSLARPDFEVVVVRPPLVHGPGAKGNLHRLCTLAWRGIPLPLASIDNRRDLIGVVNLSDLLLRCCTHPHAVGHTFLASDGRSVSTPELFSLIARSMGKPARLLRAPVGVLRAAGRLTGRGAEIDRLTHSLEIDMSDTMTRLGWRPPEPLEHGIRAMGQAFAQAAQ